VVEGERVEAAMEENFREEKWVDWACEGDEICKS